MSRRLSHYPRALRLRALAAALSLSISAAAFVVLSSLAAVERHELAALRGSLLRAATSRERQARQVDTGPPLAGARDDITLDPARSRYRRASEVNARLAEAGITVLRILPADPMAPAGGDRTGGAFRYDVAGDPTRLLGLLRSLCIDPAHHTVDPLRLWVDGTVLRAELTVRYPANEPENP